VTGSDLNAVLSALGNEVALTEPTAPATRPTHPPATDEPRDMR
jgi:hypothetical protein